MALIHLFQRQIYHVQTTKIALLRPSASMDCAFVKETEWETAANAETPRCAQGNVDQRKPKVLSVSLIQ
ncbi:unnamed protein product [Pocillopora meandrina]|uniref:Uncharacterized protein n=1 Tax=Pocillopora meandrina TaxID=46732 RepID=A0AAU9VUF9_9CNID|nr:unnamed protein product [Pocillopora meandrina]